MCPIKTNVQFHRVQLRFTITFRNRFCRTRTRRFQNVVRRHTGFSAVGRRRYVHADAVCPLKAAESVLLRRVSSRTAKIASWGRLTNGWMTAAARAAAVVCLSSGSERT